jgi:hypothetical protein
MYSTLFTTTLFFALATLGVRADFTVYTPALTQCQPATLTWDQATGPYDVIVVPASDPCGDEFVDLGDAIDTTSYQWSKVPIPAGTQVMISVVDSTGEEGWSGAITVGPSDDTSCLSSQGTPDQGTPDQGTPAQNTPPQPPKPQTPTQPSPSSSSQPAATVVGAANNGILNGASMLQFNSVAVAMTVVGALAALL